MLIVNAVSGGFDPIHEGHIALINAAKTYLGHDKMVHLIVGLNSDEWLTKKKGIYFLPFEKRKKILEGIKGVDEVQAFVDDESGSAANFLIQLRNTFRNAEINFLNGGDKHSAPTIPEAEKIAAIENKINMYFGVVPVLDSSSKILADYERRKKNVQDRVG